MQVCRFLPHLTVFLAVLVFQGEFRRSELLKAVFAWIRGCLGLFPRLCPAGNAGAGPLSG